jgi:nucleoside-diphosphate-sugar epimerase
MHRSLVTGGSGFLGSHLVEALVARGEDVRVLVRQTSNITFLESLDVELVYGDLNDSQSLKTAVQGMERVYHCAALASDWGTWEDFRVANITGLGNLLNVSLEAGVSKFVHVSTTDVYGHPNYPADETAPFRLRVWQYGDTKVKGEELVWDYHREHGLPITVVRPVNIYGPRSTSFVLELAELIKSGDMVHIGKREQPAGLTYVTNVVDMILLAADRESSVGHAYNASDGLDVSWRGYMDRLAKIVGASSPKIVIPYRLAYFAGWVMEKVYGALRIQSRPLLTRMMVELFGTNQGFPIDKARRELGYEPKVGFDEGMAHVETWLRQTGFI